MPRLVRGGLTAVILYVTTFFTAPLGFADDRGAGNTGPVGERAPTSRTQSLEVAGANISLDFLDTDFRHGTGPIVTWIERSVDVVARYYGRFPAEQLRIRVSSSEGRGVRHGTAFGGPRPLIRLQVGREVTAAELREDWILVHEMTHLALPEVGRAHAWLSEGRPQARHISQCSRSDQPRRCGSAPARRRNSSQLSMMGTEKPSRVYFRRRCICSRSREQ